MHTHPFANAFARDRGRGFGRGFGPRGRGADAPPPVERAEVAGWFAGRLPDAWFTGPVDLTIDRDEITVAGTLPEPEAGEGDPAAARPGRIARFPEVTRHERLAMPPAAQERYGRSVAWGASCGDQHEIFTNQSLPVMTRLRQAERLVLDTLVDAGVARSRSEALAWSVRLVGRNAEAWLAELRDAMASVEEV